MKSFGSPRFWICCGVLVVLALPESLPGAAPPARPDFRVFHLKHIKAVEAARLARELVSAAGESRSAFRFAIDEQTNTLFVSGTTKVDEVEAILQRIDRPRPEEIIQVVPLGSLKPSKGLEGLLRMVFANRRGSFQIDRELGVVYLSGDPDTLVQAARLLMSVTPIGGRSPDQPPQELQLRLFCLGAGSARKGGPPLPAHLADLTEELARQGLTRPALVAQVTLNTLVGTPFESTGPTERDLSELSIEGTIEDRKGRLELQLTLRANPNCHREARRPTTLRTRTVVSLGKPLLIGVVAGETSGVAFVVEVTNRAASRPAGKPASFEFRNQPWNAVFSWLSERTGQPVITSSKPTGTLTFIPPDRARKYTLGEIIDALNEALTEQKLMLIRGTRSMVIVPADEKVDPILIRRVRQVEDLKELGRTELVSMVIPLRTVKAEDLAPDIKKMLGPFGDVAALKTPNRLLIQDRVANVRRIVQLIQELESRKRR